MSAKFFFASDIHGSAFWCEKVLEKFDGSGAEKLILLGDLLYHGPRNDLPEGYDTKKTAELLNSMKDRMIAVRGNCDAEVDQMVLKFSVMADYAWLNLNGINMFATHGHLFNDEEPGRMPLLSNGDVLIHGHTHLPSAEKKNRPEGGYYLLNPGSVSIPKGGYPNSYALLSDKVFTVLDFNGNTLKEITL